MATAALAAGLGGVDAVRARRTILISALAV
eukprot:COSAG06_NODE_58604_length_276_cov_1.146893_1_plen_29_part_10